MAIHALEAADGRKRISAVIGKRPGKDSTEIQSYLFLPKTAWTPDEVKGWLKKHKKASALDAAGNSYRARQSDPDEFKKDSFRTITIKGRDDMAFDADEAIGLDESLDLDGVIRKYEGEGYAEPLVRLSEVLSEVKDGKVRIMVACTNPPGKPFEKEGRKFEITESDLQQMAENLKRDGSKPTDYSHWSAKEDAPPGHDIRSGKLFGEGTEIKPFKDAQKALWAWWSPTPRAAAFVKAGEYPNFSPEIDFENIDNLGEKRGTRLKAGALTIRPFLDDMPEIQLSDSDYNLLMGFGSESGKLVALRLTEKGGVIIDLEDKKMAAKKLDDTAQVMKRLGLKRMEGEGGEALKKFRVQGEDGVPLGEMEADDIFQALDDAGILDEVMRRLEAEGEAAEGAFGKKLAEMAGKFSPVKPGEGDVEPDENKELPPKFSAKLGTKGVKLSDVRRFIDVGRKTGDSVRIGEMNALLLKESVNKEKGTLLSADAFETRMTELAGQNKLTMADYMRVNQARSRIESGIKQGKILPREAAFYLCEALDRPKEFAAWLSSTLPRIDLESAGVIPGEDGLLLTATEEVKDKAHKLIENSKKNGKTLNLGEAMVNVRATEPELARRMDVEQKTPGIATARRPVSIVQ